MEPASQQVPPVVSVMVVHEPGEWFDETLRSLAAQDYPNLRHLFMIDGDDDEVDEIGARIRAALPQSFVSQSGAAGGFAVQANQVLRLVDGDNGLFLICHDDIALEPDAVGLLVTELYRSNAGMVGPKLVDWDEPRRLEAVGLGLDRFGEIDERVEPGEFDQEQHDAVTDVFVLPSACLLVRADLFRTLGGFDPAISYYGEDIELCWRAHHLGARVVVVPDAVVKHRHGLAYRRPDMVEASLKARHRMRFVATLTGKSRLFGRSVQLFVLTLIELVVGLFTGRMREAFASLSALFALPFRLPSILKRRRQIAAQRLVPEREVLGLQSPGSARLTTYLRARELTTYVGDGVSVRRWREVSYGPVLAWFLVVLAICVGSRSYLFDHVPQVGEFLLFPDSARQMVNTYQAAFDARSFGVRSPQPTGVVGLAALSILTAFNMSWLRLVLVVGAYMLGVSGAWRLSTIFASTRARVVGMVAYAVAPLAPGMLGVGDLSGLIWFALLPWLVHLLARSAGIGIADPDAHSDDLADGIAPYSFRRRLRTWIGLALCVGTVTAFVPAVIVVWPGVGVVVALGSVLAGASWRTSGQLVASTLTSTLTGVLLNLPWSTRWTWEALTEPRLAPGAGRTTLEVLALAELPGPGAVLALGLYLPVVAAVIITRAWRLTWAVRGLCLVVVFGAAMVAVERDLFPWSMPPVSLFAVPVGLGVALGAAALAGGWSHDVLGQGFGWRQPVAIIANLALVVGAVPALVSLGSGSWGVRGLPMPALIGSQIPGDISNGDFRVLYLGDPRLMPIPAREYAPGIAYAVADAGPLEFEDRFVTPRTRADDAVVSGLELVGSGATVRLGRLLAPLGIRYVVVPKHDNVYSTPDAPIPLPSGLVETMNDQLDLAVVDGPPSLLIFENESWLPVGAHLTGATAVASRSAGEDTISRSDFSSFSATMLGIDSATPSARADLAPGVLHVAIPFTEDLQLETEAGPISARPSFGVGTAFDIENATVGTLSYKGGASRDLAVPAQVVAWLLLMLAMMATSASISRRRARTMTAEGVLIELESGVDDTGAIRGEALSMSGEPDALQVAGEITPIDSTGALVFDPQEPPEAPDTSGPQATREGEGVRTVDPVDVDFAAFDAQTSDLGDVDLDAVDLDAVDLWAETTEPPATGTASTKDATDET